RQRWKVARVTLHNMDSDAARKARRIGYKANLAEAYDDEEAVPPEWVDLSTAIADEARAIRERIDAETATFVTDPDIRRAMTRRERAAGELTERVVRVNRMVNRLNLIAPLARFTRTALDVDELLRPLFRTPRQTSDASSG